MLGLYFHIPFCRRKCAYCDFYSICDLSLIDAYVDRLVHDIDTAPVEQIDTIFFGGGTPSLLSCGHWRRLFAHIRAHFHLTEDVEITVEANPDSLSEQLCSVWHEIGVNRISVGIQSLQSAVLEYAGRLHNSSQALSAIALAKRYFENVNADYMVGFPYQTPDKVAQDQHTLVQLGVKHISVYSLQLEPNTPLYNRIMHQNDLPDEDSTVALYDAAYDTLLSLGMDRYEISNFAFPGYQCKHNLHCWQYHSYLGFGCKAHSFYQGIRFVQDCTVRDYIARANHLIPEEQYEMYSKWLAKSDLSDIGGATSIREQYAQQLTSIAQFEYIMLGLRTAQGIDLATYRRLFGCDFVDKYQKVLKRHEVLRACELNKDYFYIKQHYLYLSNNIIYLFQNI